MIELQPLDLSKYTNDELHNVDRNSYETAKELVREELKHMEIESLHPEVRKNYVETHDRDNIDATQTRSLVLQDIEKLEQQYHDEIYSSGKKNIQIPSYNAIDLSRYENNKKQVNGDGKTDYQSLYTRLSYETLRLNALRLEKEVQGRLE